MLKWTKFYRNIELKIWKIAAKILGKCAKTEENCAPSLSKNLRNRLTAATASVAGMDLARAISSPNGVKCPQKLCTTVRKHACG